MRNHDLVVSGRKQMTHSLMLILTNLKRSHTYKDIARVAQVCPSMISSIINNDHVPTLDTLMRIADGIGFHYELKITNRNKVREAVLRADRASDFVLSKAYNNLRNQLSGI